MAELDLLDYKAISELTGITLAALRKRRCLGRMPEPDLVRGGSPLWYTNNIAAWMRNTAPGPGTGQRIL